MAAIDFHLTNRAQLQELVTTRGESTRQVGDETDGAPVAVDVVVAAVAGLRRLVVDALAVFARHRHVRQLGAVDHHQVDRRRIAGVEARRVGQGPVLDLQHRVRASSRGGGRDGDASIADRPVDAVAQ